MRETVMNLRNGRLTSPPTWYESLMPGQYATLGDLVVGMATITPDAARTILTTRNIGNRKPNQYQIARLQKTIEDGDWMLNGDSIVFDANGHMRNGQHRLMAIAASNQAIQTQVVVGVSPVAFKTMDQHGKRTLANVLGIQKEKDCTALASAIAHTCSFYRRGVPSRMSASKGTTVDDLLEILQIHPRLRESVLFFRSQSISQELRIFRSFGLCASLHYLFSKTRPDMADAFFLNICQGTMPTTPPWVGVRALVKLLRKYNESKGRQLESDTIAACTIKAWNALVKGRALKQIKMVKNEAFPELANWIYVSGMPVREIQPA